MIWTTAAEWCWVGNQPHRHHLSLATFAHCCFDISSEEDCGESWITSDLSCSLLLDGVCVECSHLEHRVDLSSTLNFGSSCAPCRPLLDSIVCFPLSSTFTRFSLFLNVAPSYLFH